MSSARRFDPSIVGGKRNGELTEAELEAPRIPRAPSTPDLVPGRDFYPLPGDASWPAHTASRAAASWSEAPAPTQRVRRGTFALRRGAFPALIATGIGFGLGVAVAWAIGVI